MYQDGTIPMYHDNKGNLWAITCHSHMGHIGMFKGASLDGIKKIFPIKTLFKTGNKNEAFNNIKYPDDVTSKGSIWPFVLYIS